MPSFINYRNLLSHYLVLFGYLLCYTQLSVYTSDLGEDCERRVFSGHKDYVNALAFDPEGSLLASVSDDLTCQLWNLRDLEGRKSETTFWLASPGESQDSPDLFNFYCYNLVYNLCSILHVSLHLLYSE